MRFRPLPWLLLALTTLSTPALAQWQLSGTPISATVDDQRVITICSDGAGGAILTWEDYRPGNFNSEVYAQRINSSGVPQWAANGVVICTNADEQYQPRIVSDNAGGAIITWMDHRSTTTYDVYAQRINSAGVVQWAANGIVVSNATLDQVWPMIAPDGSGGAVITWYDNRNNAVSQQDVYVQRINSAGTALWTANGVALSASPSDQINPQIASDGSGGAIVVWRDARAGAANLDVYAQRINSAGVTQWTTFGLAVCNAPNNQSQATLIGDGAGGAIIAWQDERVTSGTTDIYAQRLNNAGVAQWTANGQVVCNAANLQANPFLLSDGNQGVIVAWLDSRGASQDVYAQRITGPGNMLWLGNGIPICAAAGVQYFVQMISDGAGGAIMTWSDGRGVPSQAYAQHVDGFGAIHWTPDGTAISNSPAAVNEPVIAPDGSGNAIVAWYASPAGDANVYAQRIDGRYGYWGKPEPTLTAAKDVPADQGGKVRLEWNASGRDVLNQNVITHYTIWRAIDQAAFAAASASGVPVRTLSDMNPTSTGKVLRHDAAQAVDYYWELIGQQAATNRYAYAFTASTSFDSTAANAATHRFQVVSHANSDQINWPSNIVTGRSVDNLAPPAPLFLTAQRTGNYVYLKWNGVHIPDLDKYTVYRATSTGVTPIPPNFLSNDNDTLLTDSSAPASALYYIVTATDIHQNQGAKSNEASVMASTGVGSLPPITALTVLQNHPNPFTSQTELQVGLPVKGDVRVDVYDVAGRRVRTVTMPARTKGWNTLRLDAQDDRGAPLASGVYFFRVHAGNETITRKMVIAR
jgi:FlgD Ig-like domain